MFAHFVIAPQCLRNLEFCFYVIKINKNDSCQPSIQPIKCSPRQICCVKLFVFCSALLGGAGERQKTEVGEKRIATGGFNRPVISTERELGESGDWSTCQLTNNTGPPHSQHPNLSYTFSHVVISVFKWNH